MDSVQSRTSCALAIANSWDAKAVCPARCADTAASRYRATSSKLEIGSRKQRFTFTRSSKADPDGAMSPSREASTSGAGTGAMHVCPARQFGQRENIRRGRPRQSQRRWREQPRGASSTPRCRSRLRTSNHEQVVVRLASRNRSGPRSSGLKPPRWNVGREDQAAIRSHVARVKVRIVNAVTQHS